MYTILSSGARDPDELSEDILTDIHGNSYSSLDIQGNSYSSFNITNENDHNNFSNLSSGSSSGSSSESSVDVDKPSFISEFIDGLNDLFSERINDAAADFYERSNISVPVMETSKQDKSYNIYLDEEMITINRPPIENIFGEDSSAKDEIDYMAVFSDTLLAIFRFFFSFFSTYIWPHIWPFFDIIVKCYFSVSLLLQDIINPIIDFLTYYIYPVVDFKITYIDACYYLLIQADLIWLIEWFCFFVSLFFYYFGQLPIMKFFEYSSNVYDSITPFLIWVRFLFYCIKHYIFSPTLTTVMVVQGYCDLWWSVFDSLIWSPLLFPYLQVLWYICVNFPSFFLTYFPLLFQPGFYKLLFYTYWWTCHGFIPNYILIFLANYIGFPITFIFGYIQILLSPITYIIIHVFSIIYIVLTYIFIYLMLFILFLFSFFKYFFSLLLYFNVFEQVFYFFYYCLLAPFKYFYIFSGFLNFHSFQFIIYLKLLFSSHDVGFTFHLLWELREMAKDFSEVKTERIISKIMLPIAKLLIAIRNNGIVRDILEYINAVFGSESTLSKWMCFIFVIFLHCIGFSVSFYTPNHIVACDFAYNFTRRAYILYILLNFLIVYKHFLINYSGTGEFPPIIALLNSIVYPGGMIIIFSVFLILSFICSILRLRNNSIFLWINMVGAYYVFGIFIFFKNYSRFYWSGKIFLNAFKDIKLILPYSEHNWWVIPVLVGYFIILLLYLYYIFWKAYKMSITLYNTLDSEHHRIIRHFAVDFYGMRVPSELTYFVNYKFNIENPFMAEVLSKSGLDFGIEWRYFYDERIFVHEVFEVINLKLYRYYNSMIEEYIKTNLDSTKIWYPYWNSSYFKIVEFTEEEYNRYVSILARHDNKSLGAMTDLELIAEFGLTVDPDFLSKVYFVDITNKDSTINYIDPEIVWEESVNPYLGDTVFKITGRGYGPYIQEFTDDHFLHITYCLHAMEILKGHRVIHNDFKLMHFFFTKYKYLLASPTDRHENYFDEVIATKEITHTKMTEDQYFTYIWNGNDDRTIFDYLGYYKYNRYGKKYFFKTIFYRSSPDAVLEGLEFLTYKPSKTDFLNDSFTDITFSNVPEDFTHMYAAPTKQEVVDPAIHLRQWGYDDLVTLWRSDAYDDYERRIHTSVRRNYLKIKEEDVGRHKYRIMNYYLNEKISDSSFRLLFSDKILSNLLSSAVVTKKKFEFDVVNYKLDLQKIKPEEIINKISTKRDPVLLEYINNQLQKLEDDSQYSDL